MEKDFLTRDLICVVCPKGCNIRVELFSSSQGVEVKSISGNTCKHGEKYAVTECTHPTRTLTTTAKVQGCDLVSVKSTQPLPKERVMEFMKLISEVQLNAPVRIGDTVLADIGGTGIDIIATKNIG